MADYIHSSYTKTVKPGQEQFDMHTHDYYEILYFLSGDADYTVEGSIYRLHRGDMLLIRKSEAHHLILRGDATYERIVIHFNVEQDELLTVFNDRPLGKQNLLRSSEMPENNWLFYLEKICREKSTEHKKYYLLPLLHEINEAAKSDTLFTPAPTDERAAEIIKYINAHLYDSLSLEKLCEHFYISKTHINRLFKKSTGSTVWGYVTVKRLFLAKELIEGGEKPTDAYLKAGFNDYTAFFKAYKKQFGEMPKKAQKTKSNS